MLKWYDPQLSTWRCHCGISHVRGRVATNDCITFNSGVSVSIIVQGTLRDLKGRV